MKKIRGQKNIKLFRARSGVNKTNFALCAKVITRWGYLGGETLGSPPKSPSANLLRAGDITKERVSQTAKLVGRYIYAK
jgi:hypothetical protein